MEQHGPDRRALYEAILSGPLFVRGPAGQPASVTQPETGLRAIPVFLSRDAAERFWLQLAPSAPASVMEYRWEELAPTALQVGALVLEPMGENLLVDRAELIQLAHGEIPWSFAAWLREPARIGRAQADVLARLRRAHVQVITGADGSGAQRLYLLEKSEDRTPAVACFSSPDSLAQFAQVRRLFDGAAGYGVALLAGEQCIRTASGLGAYILLDPESPWETLIEPILPI